MSVMTKPPESRAIFNLPNQLTTARLVLSMILFVLIEWHRRTEIHVAPVRTTERASA